MVSGATRKPNPGRSRSRKSRTSARRHRRLAASERAKNAIGNPPRTQSRSHWDNNMQDVNEAIELANTGGASFDELSNGLTDGLALRMWATPNWMFSAAWEPLFLSTESAATNAEMNLNAHSFQLTGGYFFPSQTNAKYALAAGLGLYTISGESTDPAQTPATVEITGTGVGFHLMGLSEWTVSRGFAITGGLGYRIANIGIDDSLTDHSADYSGFMGRLGMAFYLPSNN